MDLQIKRRGWMHAFQIVCQDDGITKSLIALFGDGVSQGVLCDTPSVRIAVKSDADGFFSVCCNGREAVSAFPVQSILNHIFEQTIYHPSLFPLHSGAVEARGKAQLFLAATGTGKTTLTAYLTQKGYPYINDDSILIDMDPLSVVPDASPIHLRPESLPVLEKYGCSVNGTEVKVENIQRIVYRPEITADAPLPVGNIFFLERSERENTCVPLPLGQAVPLLMAGLISTKANGAARLKCAIRLAGQCRKLVYSDMRYVDDLLKKEQNT